MPSAFIPAFARPIGETTVMTLAVTARRHKRPASCGSKPGRLTRLDTWTIVQPMHCCFGVASNEVCSSSRESFADEVAQ